MMMPKNREISGMGVRYIVVVDRVGLTVRLQPRRLIVTLAADGCKPC